MKSLRNFAAITLLTVGCAFGLTGCTPTTANTVVTDMAQIAPIVCETITVFNVEAGAVCSAVAGVAVTVARTIEQIIVAETSKSGVYALAPIAKPVQIVYTGVTITLAKSHSQYAAAVVTELNKISAMKAAKAVPAPKAAK